MTEERRAEIRARTRERLLDAETCRPRLEPEELAAVRQQTGDVVDLLTALGAAKAEAAHLRSVLSTLAGRAASFAEVHLPAEPAEVAAVLAGVREVGRRMVGEVEGVLKQAKEAR